MAEFKSVLFDDATIDGLLQHLAVLLKGAAADPGRPLSRIPLLGDEERGRVLAEGNQTFVERDAGATLHGLVRAQAARTPEATAITCEGESLTYAELLDRAHELSLRLRARGVGRGARVAVCLERGLPVMQALLGVLGAGAAYVPLDPELPEQRLAFILDDAEVHGLVTQSSLVQRIGALTSAHALCVDQLDDDGAHAPAINDDDETQPGPQDLAYMIYTSGSTGKPKGVEVPHAAAVNFLQSMQQMPGIGTDDVLVSVTTLSFDIALLELFGPLTVGARVELASAAALADGMALEDLLSRSRATLCQATPATWRLLLEAGWPGDHRLRILCGGEAWSRALADELLPRCGALFNMYGPTETCVWSAVQQVMPGDEPVAIGPPIANTQLYVLDERLEPLPRGVPGELCIAGAGVARGYWRRPELTADRFVADPFADGNADGNTDVASPDPRSEQTASPGAAPRLYRTGDLVRRRNDGTLEFLGRLDQQVKVQGHRIELGEVEAALEALTNVRESAAAAHTFGPGDTRLVAYLVLEDDAPPEPSELLAALRERLPGYMLPGLFVPLQALPRTPNGKLNRGALPQPESVQARPARDLVPPSTEMEQSLARIWQELLSVESVSLLDNFFDLGGHSLLSMRVVARLSQETGVRLNPGELIMQTLGQVAAAATRLHSDAGADDPELLEQVSPPSGAPSQPKAGWFRRLLGRDRRAGR
ncbi:MAG: hypothetical protein DRQ55_07490 [Planctomycetota bacterium]|nr:MAG: hypothetical protein DRQ55_07490 [Planctomycetota bacterium]